MYGSWADEILHQSGYWLRHVRDLGERHSEIRAKKCWSCGEKHICKHGAHLRQEFYSLVRLPKYQTFAALNAAHGTGEGCEICKPAVGSILASAWNDHILEKKHAPPQDTNDRILANIERDET